MDKNQEQLDALKDIRSMMEQSSRFISLSGLSGVFAGIFALCGAWFAYDILERWRIILYTISDAVTYNTQLKELYLLLFADAGSVLVASLAICTLLTIRNSRKKGISIWDATAKRVLINLMIPLISGGIFCLILLYHGYFGLLAPCTLLFYGLALLNASKYTLNDVRYLGICEIILGLIASFYIGYGLIFWAIGFGALHIIYGAVMYFKYERS